MVLHLLTLQNLLVIKMTDLLMELKSNRPILSIIFPCVDTYAELLLWTLKSCSIQTTSVNDFEVILVQDGGSPGKILEIAQQDWSFPLRYVISPRIKGEEYAHKNHARNIGWGLARGEICFMCDADSMLCPLFVERVILLYKEALKVSPVVSLYPMIARLKVGMDKIVGENDKLMDVLSHLHVHEECETHPFGGFFKQENMSVPVLRPINKHPEGFPILSRELIEFLGGFDEEFLGWGGNKEEFQRRLNETGMFKQFLLHGCAVFHQPHSRNTDNCGSKENIALVFDKVKKRKTDHTWLKKVQILHEITEIADDKTA